ncbi:Ufm1-specific protease 2 [Dermatophagoides pteronyssinus]|uniref:Ufm1-specific protease 2 n=1 Tax=Dermatophagoides pteronyssinus TaxID=6956 RepID=A0ABQ8JI81_DERPT|nr:Ufm1-specific protease 2 [Dermatophagoides pteronyssinus]
MSGGKIYKFVQTLQQRLQQQCKSGEKGIIFGFNSENNSCYCIGCINHHDDQEQNSIIEDIPPGNTLLGAYFLGTSFDEDSIVDFCSELSKDKKSGKLLVYNFPMENDEKEKILQFDIKSKKLTEYQIEIVDYQQALEPLIRIDLIVNFPLNLSFEDSAVTTNLPSIIEQSKSWIFQLDKSSFQLNGREETSQNKIENLYNEIEQFDELQDLQIPGNMKKKMIEKYQRQLRNQKSSVQFKLLGNSGDEKSNNQPDKLENNQNYNFDFEMKFAYLLPMQNNLQQLYKIFVNSSNKMLKSLEKYFSSNNKLEYPMKMPKILNFFEPSNYTHIITTVYRDLDSPESYKQQRKLLHLKFLGKYSYYHYNQDNFNDSGWGCAYRSLQTIISWFQWQGYIDDDHKVPTHKQIQQALIDVGDKPVEFLGSSRWIGSQEVCYVLNHLYGIESKIIFINSSNELLDKARDLIKHFSINGTPIMIGGGVLAHTIIGVDFNQSTGDVRFLVLDPHYLGDEDLNNIHKKGGCAWKPITFWDKNSFYNLCLPQVPDDF